MKRGFVTVATGEYYCWLAENLAMSYRLFTKNEYPIWVMTDKKGAKRLSKFFDGVIVLDKPNNSFLDKIQVYENTVFEETIFLDADMNIVGDIGFLFDSFEENGSDVSCQGEFREISEETRPIHFGQSAVDEFELKKYIAFGGGIYYYKKSEKTKQLINYIYSELIPHYDNYELKYFGNSMADEPLMGLAMLIFGMKPLNPPIHVMRFAENMMETLSWDMAAQKASFVWWGENVEPLILHYATFNTYTWKYVYYNTILRCRYFEISKVFTILQVLIEEIKLFFRLVKRKDYRDAFWKWVLSHFTVEHLKYRKNQIKALFFKDK